MVYESGLKGFRLSHGRIISWLEHHIWWYLNEILRTMWPQKCQLAPVDLWFKINRNHCNFLGNHYSCLSYVSLSKPTDYGAIVSKTIKRQRQRTQRFTMVLSDFPSTSQRTRRFTMVFLIVHQTSKRTQQSRSVSVDVATIQPKPL